MKLKCASLLVFAALIFSSATSVAQKVANYAFHKYGEAGYESYGFWTSHNRRTTIDYTYGNKGKPIQLTYSNSVIFKGRKCAKLIFPNRAVVYVAPVGNKLQVIDPAKNTGKLLAWEYQGPINGVGTFCNVCAQNEREAMNIIKGYYLK